MTSALLTCESFHHASDVPGKVWDAMLENEAAANVIIPFAEKAKRFPRSDKDQLWIALYDDTKNVTFVLSCTKGPLGDYPIFIVPSKASAKRIQMDQNDKGLVDSLTPLVRCLLDNVPAKRVFSIFSLARVTETFAKIFVDEAHARQQHDIKAHLAPYYDASFMLCTEGTFNESLAARSVGQDSEGITITLRQAEKSHIDGIKVLCQGFSETSPPFVLDDAGAKLEAELLVENKQAWVHLIQIGDQEPQVACLVATTRESNNVVAVTKVFTPVNWRGRGCAARLLHRVCQHVLQQKKHVVLYVGNSGELAPARTVYDKVGFQGFRVDEPQGQQVVDGGERWLEIGFEGTTLGYW